MHNSLCSGRLMVAAWLGTALMAVAQPIATLNPDTVKAGPYDMGKMWTFDSPPRDYFAKTYNFAPDDEWFESARMAALRFADYCSASFVSANGLVMTNHHCARESGTGVQRRGEDLNATGFFARTSREERKVEGLFVDQLVKIEDITKRVQDAVNKAGSDPTAQVQAREKVFADIKTEYAKRSDFSGLELQTVTFYNGGRYSLYGFKRYTDVRLVFMPELQLGFFGGDPDNFTYPRYALDCSFFRVYDNGKPLKTEHYFKFNPEGAKEGEPVFVIGNPGRTERLKTVAELEYDRDLRMPYTLTFLRNRSAALQAYNATAKSDSVLNEIFGLENTIKAYQGQLDGLRDPYLMARKAAFEKQFKAEARRKNIALQTWDDIGSATGELRKNFNDNAYFGSNGFVTGEVLALGNLMGQYAETVGAQPQMADRFKSLLVAPTLKNRALEEAYLAAHLAEVLAGLGANDPYVRQALSGPNGTLRSPKEAATLLLNSTKLTNKAFVDDLVARGPAIIQNSDDPMLRLGRLAAARYRAANAVVRPQNTRLQVLRSQLGRNVYDVYGTAVPPDATFSLRINDGVVKGYKYNGTIAPPFTTFAGLYDRNYSYDDTFPWSLPNRWKANPAPALLKTPMNFVTTNDIIGGNSGSPIINRNLEAVGLAFDGNMESLPGNFIFVPDANRTVSVHTGGMLAAMRYIYKANRLVQELGGENVAPAEPRETVRKAPKKRKAPARRRRRR